jgi:hypothetical protein
MNTKEAMYQACKKKGIKEVAKLMGIAPTTLYNQINQNMKVPDILDRFIEFCNATESVIPMQYVCEFQNGYFIPNLDIRPKNSVTTQKYMAEAMRKFSNVLDEVSYSLEDNKICKSDSEKIRHKWEELKHSLESFVLACEFGYQKN